MFQNGTNEMDGASMVTQCPVPPGSSITYNFTVNQNGTYWYHCHTDYCYPDGYRQALDAQHSQQIKIKRYAHVVEGHILDFKPKKKRRHS